MRALISGLLALIAGTAIAADWSVQPYGGFSLLSDMNPPESMTISGEAGGNLTSPMPSINTGIGGGVMFFAVPKSEKGVFGFDVEYLRGSESIAAALANDELGAPTVDSSVSGLAVSGFFAGNLPWFSGSSYSGALGGGLGYFHGSRSIDLGFRQHEIDPDTHEPIIVEASESGSASSSTVFLNVFMTEELRLSDTLKCGAVVGYRGVPAKSATIETESLTGSYKPEFSGLYFRLGVKYDL